MAKRFSKETVANELARRIRYLEKQYGFDSRNGYVQVENAPSDKVFAYGEFASDCAS